MLGIEQTWLTFNSPFRREMVANELSHALSMSRCNLRYRWNPHPFFQIVVFRSWFPVYTRCFRFGPSPYIVDILLKHLCEYVPSFRQTRHMWELWIEDCPRTTRQSHRKLRWYWYSHPLHDRLALLFIADDRIHERTSIEVFLAMLCLSLPFFRFGLSMTSICRGGIENSCFYVEKTIV